MKDLFEDSVFKKLERQVMRKTRTALSDTSFTSSVMENLLKFDCLKQKDPSATIKRTFDGFEVKLSKPHLAFDMCNMLKEDNDVNLLFDEDFLAFEPEEELIHKSKIPLWVICPLEGGSRVVIKRAW